MFSILPLYPPPNSSSFPRNQTGWNYLSLGFKQTPSSHIPGLNDKVSSKIEECWAHLCRFEVSLSAFSIPKPPSARLASHLCSNALISHPFSLPLLSKARPRVRRAAWQVLKPQFLASVWPQLAQGFPVRLISCPLTALLNY